MLERILAIVTAAVGSGVMAGLFFAFSTSVMSALARLPSAQGAAAMQAVNVTILNPVFLLVFFGTGALSLALAAGAILRWNEPGALFVLAGGVLYVVGSIGVTMALNVPLNNALAAADPASPQGAALWARYLDEWTRWNHVRATACAAAAAAFAWALA